MRAPGPVCPVIVSASTKSLPNRKNQRHLVRDQTPLPGSRPRHIYALISPVPPVYMFAWPSCLLKFTCHWRSGRTRRSSRKRTNTPARASFLRISRRRLHRRAMATRTVTDCNGAWRRRRRGNRARFRSTTWAEGIAGRSGV